MNPESLPNESAKALTIPSSDKEPIEYDDNPWNISKNGINKIEASASKPNIILSRHKRRASEKPYLSLNLYQ